MLICGTQVGQRHSGHSINRRSSRLSKVSDHGMIGYPASSVGSYIWPCSPRGLSYTMCRVALCQLMTDCHIEAIAGLSCPRQRGKPTHGSRREHERRIDGQAPPPPFGAVPLRALRPTGVARNSVRLVRPSSEPAPASGARRHDSCTCGRETALIVVLPRTSVFVEERRLAPDDTESRFERGPQDEIFAVRSPADVALRPREGSQTGSMELCLPAR
jgi:hypothetical protein